jgi:hypothetical protein
MSTKPLPRLLGRREPAENLMRRLPKVTIGRRVFVRSDDVDRHLRNEART